MDRWKAEMGRVRENRRVEERRSKKRKSWKKEEADARKGRKVAKNCVFPLICGSGGWKSRLAKAAGAEPAGQMRDENLHAVVARSTFRSQNVQNTPFSDHFCKLRCRKIACHHCGAKQISKSKCTKKHHVRTTFASWDVEKVHAIIVARSTFPSQNVQNTPCSDHFWKLRCQKSACRCGAKHISKSKVQKSEGVRNTFGRSDVLSRGRRKGLCTLSQVSKTWGFCSISKNDGRHGAFEEDLRRCISRGTRSTKDIFIRDVRRSGRWFPERGCILEHQICRFAKMILRDRCSTSYDLSSIFRGRRSTLDRWSGKIAKRIGTRPSALHSTFDFEGKLAELLCFWCCQIQKLKKSHRITSFWMLFTSKNEEVLHNCCVFDVVNFENWESLAE